jgi:DAACS family dicarboxylate/amino acid:cation (Na+ or H+) symporter
MTNTQENEEKALNTKNGEGSPGAAPAAAKPWWRRVPLYLRIVVALVLGALAGVVLPASFAEGLNIPAQIILRLLGAIAPPLILLAVMRALIGANVRGRLAGKMFSLLALNTTVAILIGLLVANVVRPGRHASLPPGEPPKVGGNMLTQILDNIPTSFVRPLVENNVIGVILIAVAFAMAARRLDEARKKSVLNALGIGFDLILIVLHWIIAAVPLAVFCKVAYVVGTQGFKPFLALGWFIVAVLIALGLQATYYLVRVWQASWVTPQRLLAGTRDALAMAFSTASSTVAMPVTYACLREKVGLREESASLGSLVGSNFNNDGTALYEAMAALFIAQMTGTELSLEQQVLVVLTSVIASVGAAGIPEAGLVTMTLVFSAVHLPTGYIALLLPIDWFLDRCRTAINVMGDMNVSCVLDGKTQETRASEAPDPLLREIV